MNFNSILIGSEDPARLADYYTKLFGKPTWDDGGYSTGCSGRCSVYWSAQRGARQEPTTRPVDLEHREQRRAGRLRSIQGRRCHGRARAIWVRRAPGSLIATFADPDDNYFQLMTPMEPPEG